MKTKPHENDSVAPISFEDAADRILSEADEWLRIMALESETTMQVFIDIKSPHAYLSIRPTLEVARDYKVQIDFLPYTLSYETLGVSSKVESDMQRRPPSEAADRKARMYYAAARQYAALQKLPFRSPNRLLNSDLAHRAFLFAKTQDLEIAFLMSIYVNGWGSGWRSYDLESPELLEKTLKEVGASITGFEEFIASNSTGAIQLEQWMKTAEKSGITGVPHYVFHDSERDRSLGLFGREHLSLIRGKFSSQGLARHKDVEPDFSHAWRGPDYEP